MKICEQWCEVPRKLTNTFWPGSEHAWKGDEHRDGYMEAFQKRVADVLSILTLSDELSQLMTDEERVQFQLDRMFAPLEDQRPLLYNPYTEPSWARAVADYERSLAPVENAVASHFRQNVASMLDSAPLLLREFQKYRNILGRESIRRGARAGARRAAVAAQGLLEAAGAGQWTASRAEQTTMPMTPRAA